REHTEGQDVLNENEGRIEGAQELEVRALIDGRRELLHRADRDDDEAPEDRRVRDADRLLLHRGALAEDVDDRRHDAGRYVVQSERLALMAFQEPDKNAQLVTGKSEGEECEGDENERLPGHDLSLLRQDVERKSP